MDRKTLDSLVNQSQELRGELLTIYERIPGNLCERKTHCCSLLPETSFLEFLQLYRAVRQMAGAQRQSVISGIARYYFVNAVERIDYPFLQDKDCMVYQMRPLPDVRWRVRWGRAKTCS